MGNASKKRSASRASKPQGHSQTAKDSLERRTEIGVFMLVAYKMLRADNPKGGKHESVHTVWTGFNEAFREFFPDEDAIACQKEFAKNGLIVTSPFRGGALLRPTLDLLHEPTKEEIAIAARVSKFIPGFKVAHAARQEAYRARRDAGSAPAKSNAKRSVKERKAHELMASGDIDAAIEKLGYR